MDKSSGGKVALQHKFLSKSENSLSKHVETFPLSNLLEESLISNNVDTRNISKNLVCEIIKTHPQILQNVWQQLMPRLHRLNGHLQYLNASQLLIEIWKASPLTMDHLLLEAIRIHPDLLSPLLHLLFMLIRSSKRKLKASEILSSSQTTSQSNLGLGAQKLLLKGLEDWTEIKTGSALLEANAWYNLITDALIETATFAERKQLYPLLTNFFHHFPIHLVPSGIDMILRLLRNIYFTKFNSPHLDHSDDDHYQIVELAYALVDWTLRAKFAHPQLNLTMIIEIFSRLIEEIPIDECIQLALVHPIFSEQESMALMDGIGKSDISKTAVLMLVADYPMLCTVDGSLGKVDLSMPDDLKASSNLAQPRNALLLCLKEMPSSLLLEQVIDAADNCQDLAYAYYSFQFGQALKTMSLEALDNCVKLTRLFPGLAQRTFLLLCYLIKVYPTEPTLVVGSLDGLIKMASFKEDSQQQSQQQEKEPGLQQHLYSRDRSLALLRGLGRGSIHLRSIIVPKLADCLGTIPAAFEIINELTPSLLYSADATQITSRAYCITAFNMTFQDRRQSYLKLAMSLIHTALRSITTTRGGEGHDLDIKSITLLIMAMENLVRLEYVAPKLLWTELLKPLLIEKKDFLQNANFNGQLCSLLAYFSKFIPQHEEDYAKVDGIISEEILPFLLDQIALFPAGALASLVQFPPTYLTLAIGLNLNELIKQVIDRLDSNSFQLETWLKIWLKQDIDAMPRSLFLGTFEASKSSKNILYDATTDSTNLMYQTILRQKCRDKWNTSLALAIAYLATSDHTTIDFLQLVRSLILLPALSLQHWLWRLEMVVQMASFFTNFLAWLQDQPNYHSLVEQVDTVLEASITNSTTMAALSWSLLIQFLFHAIQSRLEGKEGAIELLTTLLIIERTPIPERYRNNDEVLAAVILGVWIQKDNVDEKTLEMLKTQLENGAPWIRDLYRIAFQTELSPVDAVLLDPETMLLDAITKSKAEPPYSKGLIIWQMASRYEQDSTWQRLGLDQALEILSKPGPATKKADSCLWMAGLLRVGRIRVEEDRMDGILESINDTIQKCSDPKIEAWLLIMLAHVMHRNRKSSRPIAESNREYVHRFGSESAFGICLDVLNRQYGQESFRKTIISVLATLTRLPRLNWARYLPELSDKFLLAHYYQEGGHIDNVLFEKLWQRIMQDNILKSEENLSQLLQVIDDPTKSDLLLDLIRDPSLFQSILEHSEAFSRDKLVSWLRSLPRNNFILWKLVAEKKLLENSFITFLNSTKSFDAVMAVYEDPISLELVAQVLSSKPTNSIDLASYYLLALQEGEGQDSKILAKLFCLTLINIAQPALEKFPLIIAVRIAWDILKRVQGNIVKSILHLFYPILPLLQDDELLSFLIE